MLLSLPVGQTETNYHILYTTCDSTLNECTNLVNGQQSYIEDQAQIIEKQEEMLKIADKRIVEKDSEINDLSNRPVTIYLCLAFMGGFILSPLIFIPLLGI